MVIPLPQCCVSFLLQLRKASLGPQQILGAVYFSVHHEHQTPPWWKLPEGKFQPKEATQMGLISINNPGKWTSLICKMSVLVNNKESYFPTKPFSCRRLGESGSVSVNAYAAKEKRRDNMGTKWSELDPVKRRGKLICHGLHNVRLLSSSQGSIWKLYGWGILRARPLNKFKRAEHLSNLSFKWEF